MTVHPSMGLRGRIQGNQQRATLGLSYLASRDWILNLKDLVILHQSELREVKQVLVRLFFKATGLGGRFEKNTYQKNKKRGVLHPAF